jgi:hypothetical protein
MVIDHRRTTIDGHGQHKGVVFGPCTPQVSGLCTALAVGMRMSQAPAAVCAVPSDGIYTTPQQFLGLGQIYTSSGMWLYVVLAQLRG